MIWWFSEKVGLVRWWINEMESGISDSIMCLFYFLLTCV